MHPGLIIAIVLFVVGGLIAIIVFASKSSSSSSFSPLLLLAAGPGAIYSPRSCGLFAPSRLRPSGRGLGRVFGAAAAVSSDRLFSSSLVCGRSWSAAFLEKNQKNLLFSCFFS